MRRQLMLSAVLAASVAVIGACQPAAEDPKPKPATPSPSATASPSASPTASGSPAKPGSSPEAKKSDDSKDAKLPPASTPANK